MLLDIVYFEDMLELMRTKEYKGYITWTEAHIAVGLPRCYSRTTNVSAYGDEIVAILPDGDHETVYFLRNGYDPN
jgi:hypothetical protein|tara:strand:+ start:256 stop:480 length:225 start_codon:yes stop_codon:yes gene_type:complete